MSEIRLVRLVFQLDQSNDQSYSYRYWIVYIIEFFIFFRIFCFLLDFLLLSDEIFAEIELILLKGIESESFYCFH